MKNLAKNFALDTEFLLIFAAMEHAAATQLITNYLPIPPSLDIRIEQLTEK